MLSGTILAFLAEALALPIGILIAALLTKHLGAGGYGLFTLAATLVIWIESLIVSLFAGATVKLVSEAAEWRPVATAALRLYTITGVGAMIVLWVLASPIAILLNEPALANLLSIYAVDIPVSCLVHAHRSILIGTGGFTQRALASMVRFMARYCFVALLVGLGLAVPGAILGYVGASVVELMLIRRYVRPTLLGRCEFPLHKFRGYTTPLFLSNLSLSLFERLDLLMIQWLGGRAEFAGIYGVAQTLSTAPGIVTAAVAPLLLSSQSRMLQAGQQGQARDMGREALRAATWLFPMSAAVAGAAPEIVAWIYGKSFSSAALPFGILILGQTALVMRSVITTSLIAAGRPAFSSTLAAPLVPLAMVGHLVLIPHLGSLGASLVTAGVAVLGVLAAVVAGYHVLGLLPPPVTLARGLLLCGLAYFAAASWPAPGLLLLVKLPLLAVGVMLGFVVLGEFTARDLELVRDMLRWDRTGERTSRGV
jgi:O-antigen/teichoic acid export membrane protein